MSQLRFGFLWGAVWVCLFVLVVGPWWVGLFGSGSYPRIRLFEFIQGDLCLSAHIAPVPVQKNPNGLWLAATAVPRDQRAQSLDCDEGAHGIHAACTRCVGLAAQWGL